MKQLLLLYILFPSSLFACLLKLTTLHYEPVKPKSNFQEILRQEIGEHFDNKECIPLLVKKGIIRKAEEIQDRKSRSDTSFGFALKEITGFSDGILVEMVPDLFDPSKTQLNISLNIQKYFKQVKKPQRNDLVVYIQNNLQINYCGVYHNEYTICSKMGIHPYSITHILFNIPFFSDNDSAVFFRVKKKYKDQRFLIQTMRNDNLENILKIFYYKYFKAGRFTKDQFIPIYSDIICDSSLVNIPQIKLLMRKYNWKKTS